MYIPPLTLDIIAWCSAALVGGAVMVAREINPNTRMGYSKFAGLKHDSTKIPSLLGMLLIYTPSLVGSCVLLAHSVRHGLPHVRLLTGFTVIHFLKRVYEVLFVHRYSGQSVLLDAAFISSSYLSFAMTQWYFATRVPYSLVNSRQLCLGAALFVLGEGINFYHHKILASLRKNGNTAYKIPQGGLFRYVWCPHYLGEIISFMAMTLLSQHGVVLVYELMAAAYLGVRARQTQKWYFQQFNLTPAQKTKACLIPGIY
ncbi:3-oxo-5-alpha-steroid 4-dehydrogenase-domain-containing protein [Gongronella butleri]|nr:3-oxo-5-alpha-steroid 4-dehydrogenase-domain-containing protein [Gongronella butleri]